MHVYFAALDKFQQEDPEVRQLMTEVYQLLQPLSVLQQEPLRSRILCRMQTLRIELEPAAELEFIYNGTLRMAEGMI